MKNRNQIGPENEVERYGLYLVNDEVEECIKRSDDKSELIEEMHYLAKCNYHTVLYMRKSIPCEERMYEVRDESWGGCIYVEASCGFYEED